MSEKKPTSIRLSDETKREADATGLSRSTIFELGLTAVNNKTNDLFFYEEKHLKQRIEDVEDELELMNIVREKLINKQNMLKNELDELHTRMAAYNIQEPNTNDLQNTLNRMCEIFEKREEKINKNEYIEPIGREFFDKKAKEAGYTHATLVWELKNIGWDIERLEKIHVSPTERWTGWKKH